MNHLLSRGHPIVLTKALDLCQCRVRLPAILPHLRMGRALQASALTRLSRSSYEETKKDVAKWTRIVRANREAPTLVFTGSRNDVPRTTTTSALIAKFQPEGGMEAEVAAMLRAAGVHNDTAVQEAEDALAVKVHP